MNIFEYLQLCSKEEFAEWVDETTQNMRKAVLSDLEPVFKVLSDIADWKFTDIVLSKEVRISKIINFLDEEYKK